VVTESEQRKAKKKQQQRGALAITSETKNAPKLEFRAVSSSETFQQAYKVSEPHLAPSIRHLLDQQH